MDLAKCSDQVSPPCRLLPEWGCHYPPALRNHEIFIGIHSGSLIVYRKEKRWQGFLGFCLFNVRLISGKVHYVHCFNYLPVWKCHCLVLQTRTTEVSKKQCSLFQVTHLNKEQGVTETQAFLTLKCFSTKSAF